MLMEVELQRDLQYSTTRKSQECCARDTTTTVVLGFVGRTISCQHHLQQHNYNISKCVFIVPIVHININLFLCIMDIKK